MLKHMIELRPARNTSLIDITVYSDDKEEAKRIANAIAEVYADYRRKQRQDVIEGGLTAFKKELARPEPTRQGTGRRGGPAAQGTECRGHGRARHPARQFPRSGQCLALQQH